MQIAACLNICSERLPAKAIYVKPHGGVEDLRPRALKRLRSRGLERTGANGAVVVEISVSLSLTWVGIGTLANARGLRVVKILIIYE